MQLLAITTPLLRAGDDLAAILTASASMQTGDILVVSSKAIATVEGAIIDLGVMKPTTEAISLAQDCHQDPRFTQAILEETKRMNGEIVGTCPFAILTSLKPDGMKTGRILCPNAGLDQSNVLKGFAIGWPRDPVRSVRQFSGFKFQVSSFKFASVTETNLKPETCKLETISKPETISNVAVIISDSCCRPGRLGVTAFALVCCGIEPFRSEIGVSDLFGKKLRVTQEAVADQLATAANAVMGNAAESCPAAIIRDHGYTFSDFCGWVEGIAPEEDLFRGKF